MLDWEQAKYPLLTTNLGPDSRVPISHFSGADPWEEEETLGGSLSASASSPPYEHWSGARSKLKVRLLKGTHTHKETIGVNFGVP